MSRMPIRVSLAALTLIAGGAVPAQALPSAAAPMPCIPLLAANAHGRAAVAEAGAKMADIAALNNTTVAEITDRLSTDSSFWLDRCGMGYYVEPISTVASPVVFAPTANDYAQTFLLHSNPGSNRTVYLDFTGDTITGTAWNNSYNGGVPWFAPAFSSDTDTATFTNAEQDIIQSVWQRVAEDFAPFDIDVTTEDPGVDALNRTTSSDLVYGTRALITNDTIIGSTCSCGGVAYVGTIDNVGNNYYMPAWVFKNGLGASAKNIAEATSHEVGHNLGLSHDALSTAGYYGGRLGWAPIMGVGYYEPLAQWSKGEYPDATQTQDDFAVMASNGTALRTDEDANTAASARPIDTATTVTGVINAPTDVDWLSFTPGVTGNYTFSAVPQYTSPNLDIALDLYNGATRIDGADTPFLRTNGDVASGLSATIGATLQAGTTYTLRLDGVGAGALNTGGYSDYGSLGNYQVTVSNSVRPLAFTQIWTSATTVPNATVGVPYSRQLSVIGGVQPYATWSVTGLPAWLSMSASGRLTGTPSATGSATFTVTVTDAVGTSLSKAYTITTVAAPAITTSSLGGGLVGAAYSATLAGSGGTSAYRWTATGIPAGMKLDIGTGGLSGTPTTAATNSVIVTLTDATGVTATKTLALNVAAVGLAITAKTLTAATQGNAYSATEAATGGATPYTWSASGLPAGLGISASTGTISGTPTVAGTFSVALTVNDPYGRSATATQALTVAPSAPLVITTSSLPDGTVGTAYSVTATASGGTTPYAWSATGLPAGYSINASTGVISGSTATAGTYTVTISAVDAAATTDSRTLGLLVAPAPLVITTSALASGSLNVAYSANVAATGGTAPYSWAASGLPAGVTIDTSTGTINGTPTASGTFNVLVTVSDAATPAVVTTRSLTLTIAAAAPSITTTSLPTATFNVRYSATLSATGGTGAFTWSLASGTLPNGLKLSTTGAISGTPKKRGTFNFTVRVTDAAAATATKSFTLTL